MLSLKHIATYLILAGAIKVWQSGEDVTSTDLNANFAHIHGKMVGGHGARLVDADVNASAAIAYTKLDLAGDRLIPRAWGYTSGCAVPSCTISSSKNVTSIARTGAGRYTITLNYTPSNINYLVICTIAEGTISTVHPHVCGADNYSGATFQVYIDTNDAIASNSPIDLGFSFIVMDDD
jgi:hypothetical protein